jgi:DNA-binding XRE family transcriptional regulator
MSVKTETRREQGANSDVELWVSLCKTVAFLLARLPEEADREDLTEVMLAMGHSEEEAKEGEETIREILSHKTGIVVPVIFPSAGRNEKVAKWSNYAGGRVRELRKRAKLTQDELAKKAELPQSHISRIENGEISPTRHTLEKIVKALELTISDFDPTP